MVGLTVGVSRFPNSSDLEFVESDAQRISKSFQHIGVTVTTLLNPTRAELLAQIAKILATLGPDESFYFYFVGHGWSDSGTTYLGTADASIQNGRPTDGFQFDSLKATMGEARLKRAFAFLDMCRIEVSSR